MREISAVEHEPDSSWRCSENCRGSRNNNARSTSARQAGAAATGARAAAAGRDGKGGAWAAVPGDTPVVCRGGAGRSRLTDPPGLGPHARSRRLLSGRSFGQGVGWGRDAELEVRSLSAGGTVALRKAFPTTFRLALALWRGDSPRVLLTACPITPASPLLESSTSQCSSLLLRISLCEGQPHAPPHVHSLWQGGPTTSPTGSNKGVPTAGSRAGGTEQGTGRTDASGHLCRRPELPGSAPDGERGVLVAGPRCLPQRHT